VSTTTESVPRTGDDVARVRAGLAAAQYHESAVRDLLAVAPPTPLPPTGHPQSLVRAANGPPSPLRTLTRLLLLGAAVDEEELTHVPALVDALVGADLVAASAGRLRPLVRVTPFGDLLLAGDLHNEDSAHVRAESVENPHGPTGILAQVIPRERVRRSLDIGTGCGVHAIQLATHSGTVLGVDVSPRAAHFARFNAELNAHPNVRFALSNVVHGLDGEEPFDLIVSNPPYLISPETTVVYRDGVPGHGHIGTRVLTEAPSLLADGGLLVCLTSWGVADEGDPAAAVRQIAEQAGCHGLVLVYARRTPLDNALRWNLGKGSDELARTADTWLDFYRRNRMSELAYGIVVLTPANGMPPWLHVEHVSVSGQRPDGGQIRDIMAALDRKHRGYVHARPRLHPDHEITSVSGMVAGRRVVREQSLCSTRGIRFAAPCGPRLLDLVTTGDLSTADGAMATMVRRLSEIGLLTTEGGGIDERR
jgi:hypothetical protein